MKSQLLILLLTLIIIPTVVLNVLYLKRVVTVSDLEKDGDKPILQKPSPQEKRKSPKSKGHRVAGLNCETYGGPSEGDAAEMVYWRDIPSDANFKSPHAAYGPEPKYLTFEHSNVYGDSRCAGPSHGKNTGFAPRAKDVLALERQEAQEQ
jgi:hypothetical protein